MTSHVPCILCQQTGIHLIPLIVQLLLRPNYTVLAESQASALDCVEEAQAAVKHDRCPILQQIAKANQHSADEPWFKSACWLWLGHGFSDYRSTIG